MFTIKIGGLLTSDKNIVLPQAGDTPTKEEKAYMQRVIGYYLSQTEAIKNQRRENHHYLEIALREVGCTPRLSLAAGVTPGAFLFSAPEAYDLPKLKEKLWQYGIQCSVFYGEQAFYVPVHQRLAKEDLSYFVEAIKS
jgi:hypothetical protein